MSEAPPPPPSDPTGPTQPSGSVPPPPPPAAPGAPPAGHGAPPAPGYGAPPAPGYGAPPAPGYGAPPAPGYGAPAGALADWPLRAYSGLIDWFGPGLVAGVIYQGSNGLGSLLYLAALAWAIYNAYLGGQTGQSFGKKIAGTRLVAEATGQPPGGGLGIGRYFLHILDALPCYLGFLWPLWDAKRQTFADKILKTIVVKV